MLDEKHPDLPKPSHDSNTYTLGSIGKHNIVIACLPRGRYGNNTSATVATQMVSAFPSIKVGLMVGIGGGVPPKVRLGDVVVSTPVDQCPGVIQWDFGKAEDGGLFRRTGALNNPPTALLTALTKLDTVHEMEGSAIPQYLQALAERWPRLASKYLRSATLEDVLFLNDYHHVKKADDHDDASDKVDESQEDCRECDKTKAVSRKARDMHIHYGLIASGNQVIKDADRRDEINAMLGGGTLCFEMEAAGLMNDFPCLVIRGICDYAGKIKSILVSGKAFITIHSS